MKTIFGLTAALGLAAIVLMPAIGSAQGHHGHDGQLMPPVVWKMVPHQQVKAAIMADRTNLKNLHEAMRSARQQLTLDLVAGKDTTADVTALETAHHNMLAEKVKLAKTILSSLSAAQRSQATKFVTQWQAMQDQQMQQRHALFQKFNGAATSDKAGAKSADQ
ncbi:MAG TPA: hypothetical protein VMV15_05745 [Candidatus Binataceae bacterium]|nr:hypothetical protein [Candidatus Binataceae bacterium]